MGLFAKVQKNSAYFKRFQVKYRRRRECKTDYKARRRLIQQDKNKYNTPKYRFVVRRTNKDIITQIVHSQVAGDVVLCAAYSHELAGKYGVKVGLTNYAAAYATGLLCARRLLTKLKMADKYAGVKEVTGNYTPKAKGEESHAFRCVLDVGLYRTTSGSRVFAALKGAVDGGLDIPHSPARFSGYAKSTGKLDSKKFRERLLGGHVAKYMKDLVAKDPAAAQANFKRYMAAGINAGKIEAMWLECHKMIRADPSPAAKKPAAPAAAGKAKPKPKRYGARALTVLERLHIRDQRRAAFKRKAADAFAAAAADIPAASDDEGDE